MLLLLLRSWLTSPVVDLVLAVAVAPSIETDWHSVGSTVVAVAAEALWFLGWSVCPNDGDDDGD